MAVQSQCARSVAKAISPDLGEKQKQSLGARVLLASDLVGTGREAEAESGACVLLANDLIGAGRDVYV